MDDDEIRTLVTRLARPQASGGHVVERAAVLAEGPGSAEILKWIASHGGQPEVRQPSTATRGLHSARKSDAVTLRDAEPQRYVFAPGVLD